MAIVLVSFSTAFWGVHREVAFSSLALAFGAADGATELWTLSKIWLFMEESNYLKKLSDITHHAAASWLMSLLISVYQTQSLEDCCTVILCSGSCRVWQEQRCCLVFLATEYPCKVFWDFGTYIWMGMKCFKICEGFNFYIPKLVPFCSEILFIPNVKFCKRVNKVIKFQLLLKYSKILIYSKISANLPPSAFLQPFYQLEKLK